MTNTRLLIIHQGSLGDVVLTFPAIIRLHQKFGRIDILCQHQLGKLAAKLGLVENWYPLEAASFATLFSEQVDQKITDILNSYSTVLIFSFNSALENTVNRITGQPSCRIPPRPPATDKIHVTEFLFKNLIDDKLLETADSNGAIADWHSKQNHRTGRPANASKILIHPGSGSTRKRWPLAQFLKLAGILTKNGLQPQFICGPAETDLKAELQRQNQNVQHLSEPAVLVDLLQSAGGYIGNDSGVSHLAAFLGLPSAVIFGPTDPVRWKPLGARVEIVHPALSCRPCFEIESENCAEPECLADTTVESVLKAFYQVHKSQ